MAFQYVLTFSLMVIETVLFSLISLPLPSKLRKPLLKTLSIPFNSPQFQLVLKCVFVFVAIMFADSINRTIKIDNDLNSGLAIGSTPNANVPPAAGSGIARTEIQAQKFYAQRNMYLCGFTLFLSLILNRTFSMVFELLEIKEKLKGVQSNDVKSKKLQELKEEKEALLSKSEELSKEYKDE